MTIIKSKAHFSTIILYMLLFVSSNLIAQVNLNDTKLYETKTFGKNNINVIQSLYLDDNGIPSHKKFLVKHGLNPQYQTREETPCFSFSVSQNYLLEEGGKFILKKDAELLNLDFHVESIEEYKSVNEAKIIWDGRVYSENNELIVGGYSSKYNERPVGKINSKGLFVSQLEGEVSKEFPIIQLASDPIIFDPFSWQLLQLTPSGSNKNQKSTSQFLPLEILSNSGEELCDISFQLVRNEKTSSLQLIGRIDGKSFEIANCSLANLDVIKTKEAFRPELIDGCSQLGGDDIINLTLKGTFSNNISFIDGETFLKDGIKFVNEDKEVKISSINIDGDFKEWRNISGISDVEGDFVSYLFENPDTDLLEFKLSNDDKFLYLYSRVVGAHGRTGEKGRYYWYVYIDVDTNPQTGYPPTRDDNCYFGIPIGDDTEAQFEFIGNKFVKTFFGFTGIGTEKEVLSGTLELGPSYYSSTGKDGKKRDKYKTEYVHREGSRFITHDYTEGTSEDIIIALSPDGSEVEVKVELAGFLKDNSGNMLMYRGKKIDIAVGVEGSSNHYGSGNWGADSSPVIYGYKVK